MILATPWLMLALAVSSLALALFSVFTFRTSGLKRSAWIAAYNVAVVLVVFRVTF